MSLKEFLESNTVSTLGSTLPIPYMENITIDQEDSMHTLTIKTAFYIHVDADTYSQDEGEDYEDFILNSAGLESYMVLTYDRSSKLESYGLIAGDEDEGAATYSSWPITGFSSIKNGSISPLKCVYRSRDDASTPIHKVVTLLNAPDINNLWMRATLLYLMHTNYGDASFMSGIDLPDGDYAGSFDSAPTFKISDDGNTIEGTMVGLDSISLISDLSDEADWWTTADLYSKLLALAGNNSWAMAINAMYAQIIDKQSSIYMDAINVWRYPGTAEDFSKKIFDEHGEEYVLAYLNINPTLTGDQSVKSVHMSKTIWSLGAASDYQKTETVYHADGGATYKYSNTTVLTAQPAPDMDFDADGVLVSSYPETHFPAELLDPTETTGATAIAAVSFFTSLDLYDTEITDEIFDSYANNTGDITYYESFVSPLNYCAIFRNDVIATDPIEVFKDSNENYHELVITSLAGLYYAETRITLSDIVGSIASIVVPSSMDQSVADSLSFILSVYGDSPDLLPQLNIFRRTFPDKSTVTPTGQFYNTFAQILYDSNTIVERGTQVYKALLTNPVLRDFRFETDSTPEIFNRSMETYDLQSSRQRAFDISKSIWSRWTEIMDIQSDERNFTTVGGARYYDGGHYDYNFIDQGYVFFNYERAIKEDSFLAEIMSVAAFERYFGQKVTNAAYKIRQAKVTAIYDGRLYQHADGSKYNVGDSLSAPPDTMLTVGVDDTPAVNVGTIILTVGYPEGKHPTSLYNVYENINTTAGGILVDDSSEDGSAGSLYEGNHFNVAVSRYPVVLESTDGGAYEMDFDWSEYVFTASDPALGWYDADTAYSSDNAEGSRIVDAYEDFNELEDYIAAAAAGIDLTEDASPGLGGGPRNNPKYGGAEFMEDDISFSFLALRGWSPMTETEGGDALEFDSTFLAGDPIHNRIMCFEYKKNDHYDGSDASADSDAELLDEVSLLVEQKNTNIYFDARLLVIDKTYDLFLEIWSQLLSFRSYITEYLEAAEDFCSYNPGGYFNEHFVTAMNERYPVESEAPWYKASVLYHLFLDILHGQYEGNVTEMIKAIKADVYNLRPETGNLESIQNFSDRFAAVLGALEDFVPLHLGGNDTGEEYYSTVEDRKFICFGSNVNSSEDQEDEFTLSFRDEDNLWKPSETYDNYPLYPSTARTTTTYGPIADGPDAPDNESGAGIIREVRIKCWPGGEIVSSYEDCPEASGAQVLPEEDIILDLYEYKTSGGGTLERRRADGTADTVYEPPAGSGMKPIDKIFD